MPSKEEKKAGAPLWMGTFADMMSLLLCFFILLFALSTLEKVKYKQTIASIQGSFGKIPNIFRVSWRKPVTIQPQEVQPVQRTKDVERAKEAIAEKARSKLVVDDPSKEVIVEGVKEGIRFSLAGRVLFEPGKAVLNSSGKEMLLKVLEILQEFENLSVQVTGHTDSRPPPPNSPYRNNWKLAEARAWITTKFLIENDKRIREQNEFLNITPLEERISYKSAGQYHPRFPNDSPETRALNRRIEIMLLQGRESITVPGELKGTDKQHTPPNAREIIPKL